MKLHQEFPMVPGNPVRRTMAGVTLIETLVGIALGFLVVMVITQVWGVFESQRGRTASGSTAQETGLIAMAQLNQSIHNAGSGFNAGMFQCAQVTSFYNDGASTTSPIPTTTPVPALIVNGTGTTGSDQIRITWATNIGGAIEATTTAPLYLQGSNPVLTLDNVKSFTQAPSACPAADSQSHLVVCRRTANNQCVVSQTTNINAGALTLTSNSGQALCPYNPTTHCYNTGTCPIGAGDTCYSIGSFVTDTYSLNANQQLQVVRSVNGISSAATILADNVVSLQAQYGVAPTGSQTVSCWTNAAATGNPTCAGDWTPASLTAAQVSRIKALRVVIVVRSPRLEPAAVTPTCTTTGGIANNGPCAWNDSATNPAPQIDLSGDPNWQRYRYRPYQTIIPLRNVIWANI